MDHIDFSFFSERTVDRPNQTLWRWRRGCVVSTGSFPTIMDAVNDARRYGFTDGTETFERVEQHSHSRYALQ